MNLKIYIDMSRKIDQLKEDIQNNLSLNYEQTAILYYVYSHQDEEITAKHLYEKLKISRPNITHHLKVLIKENYINKYRDIKDERFTYIGMNEAQKENAEAVLDLIEEYINQYEEV